MMRLNRSFGLYAIGYVILFLFCSFYFSMLIPNSLLASIVIYLVLFACSIAYICITNVRPAKTLHLHSMHPSTYPLLILLSLTIRPFIGWISQISNLIFTDFATKSMMKMSQSNIFLTLLASAVMPALVEEFIFRGVVYSGVRKAQPIRGILLSSLFFGLAHLNVQQFCYTIALGIILGLLVEATNSLFASMIVHFSFNGLSIILMYLIPSTIRDSNTALQSGGKSLQSIILALGIATPFALGSLLISVALIVLMSKLNHRYDYLCTWINPKIRKSWPKEKAANAAFYIALVLCVIMMFFIEFASHLS